MVLEHHVQEQLSCVGCCGCVCRWRDVNQLREPVNHYVQRSVSCLCLWEMCDKVHADAAWEARGLRVFGFTEEQLESMRTLRTATLEFAALTRNKYMPPGFTLEDLLRIYIAQAPGIVTEHDSHLCCHEPGACAI